MPLPDVFVTATLTEPEAAAVIGVLRDAERHDGLAPLDEAAQLLLTKGGATHALACGATTPGAAADSSPLLGYAQFHDGQVSVVVHPNHRRASIGSHLLQAVLAGRSGSFQGWAHGNTAAAAAFALTHGCTPIRTLLRLGATLTAQPDRALVERVTVRPFQPADLAEIVALHAHAFADHPEQSRWQAADFLERMAQPWFQPNHLLVATDTVTGELLGFHWLKHTTDAAIEVYILAVGPAAQGRGVGRTLLQHGLRLAWDAGLPAIDLYVEADNAAAVQLYRSQGFDTLEEHVMYEADHSGIARKGPAR